MAMDTRPSTAHAVSPHEAAFINSLPMINDVIRAVCRRGRVSADEEKEFASSVILKLIGNDYQIFRQFRGGTAALRTFLFKVIHRHLMDRRNSEWGRWRPSKPAKALGSAALYLERLVYRDRTNIGDAVALVANSPKWGLSSRAVRSLYAKLPTRALAGRRNEPLEAAVDRPADPQVDSVERGEQRRDAARVRDALVTALRHLTEEERRLLRLRYQDGVSVMDIAALANEDPQALYRRYTRILKQLCAALTAQGLTDETIRSLLGHAGDELDTVLLRMCANGQPSAAPRSLV
jgi:RNA polymerase sigma factor (sigma-70 family)